MHQQPYESHFIPSYHNDFQNQAQWVANTCLDDILFNFQDEMRSINRNQDHIMHKEEWAY